MRYYNNVAWLKPFVEASKGLVPLRKLEVVKGYRVPLDKVQVNDASCVTRDFKTFTICIRIQNHAIKRLGKRHFKTVKYTRRSVYDILHALAHELAHLKHWDHTPEHLKLESRLTRRFALMLDKADVKDTTLGRPLNLE